MSVSQSVKDFIKFALGYRRAPVILLSAQNKYGLHDFWRFLLGYRNYIKIL